MLFINFIAGYDHFDYDRVTKVIFLPYHKTKIFLACFAVDLPSSFYEITSKWFHEVTIVDFA